MDRKDLMRHKDLEPVMRWYQETVGKLPEMRVNITPLKDTKESTVNPNFFSYANVDVTVPSGSWQQGGIIQRGEKLPTSTNETQEFHGVTILLTDPDGKIFVTVSQEPMAGTKFRTSIGTLRDTGAPGTIEIHPVVRSPLQTSTEKLSRVTASEHQGRAIDPTMTTILKDVAEEQRMKVSDLINHIPLAGAPTDGNRMQSDILYGSLAVSGDLAAKIAHDVPGGRWVSPRELDALTILGATNGNLNIARNVTEVQQRFSTPK